MVGGAQGEGEAIYNLLYYCTIKVNICVEIPIHQVHVHVLGLTDSADCHIECIVK